MPLYAYRYTDVAGGGFDQFGRMSDEALTEHEGRPCERTVSLPHVRTIYGKGNGCKPIEMMSIALMGKSEIDEFRKRNPGTEISSDRKSELYGVPIAKSRTEKLRILDKEGFYERN